MSPNPSPQQRPKAGWWLVWLVAVMVLPAMAPFFRAEASLACVAGGLVVHFIASMKLDTPAFWQSALIFWSGWALMLVSFFAGCVYAPV